METMQAKVQPPYHVNRKLRAWLVLGVLVAMAGAVWAQAADHQPKPIPADRTKAGGPQHQRRAALRAALLAQREADAPKPDRPVRQLTPAERAKLREQLRQQRRDAPPDRNGQSQ
jgi:hypothetical protein